MVKMEKDGRTCDLALDIQVSVYERNGWKRVDANVPAKPAKKEPVVETVKEVPPAEDIPEEGEKAEAETKRRGRKPKA